MAKANTKKNLVAISMMTALAVGAINTASAYIAYSSFMPKRQATVDDLNVTDSTQVTATFIQPSQSGASSQSVGSSSSPTPASNSTGHAVRKPNAAIVIGQVPLPANVTTSPDGNVTYTWCSGINPSLEDKVCEAVISIAANPTASNPHLSEKAKKSLSMLPENSTLTMDEASWTSSSPTSGTMLVTVHTKSYGDVKLKLFLEKINNIWIVDDGQLA